MIRRAGLLACAALLLVTPAACRHDRDGTKSSALPAARAATPVDPAVGRAPPGVRIKVEVLNATRSRGLARRVTLYLRDRGFDVVAMGTSARTQSNTIVLDRSNHPDWARLIARALRADTVQERPDTSRYLDATVLIGTEWAAPALPFHP